MTFYDIDFEGHERRNWWPFDLVMDNWKPSDCSN